MIARLLVLVLAFGIACPSASASSSGLSSTALRRVDSQTSGTATVTNTNIPALMGLSCPAIWGVYQGDAYIVFVNPVTGGVVVLQDGIGGVSVDIQPGAGGDTVTVSDGSSFVDCDCVAS